MYHQLACASVPIALAEGFGRNVAGRAARNAGVWDKARIAGRDGCCLGGGSGGFTYKSSPGPRLHNEFKLPVRAS